MKIKYNFNFEPVSVYANVVELILRKAKHGSTHVDLGCGNAAIAEALNSNGIKYIGFDGDIDTVENLRKRGIEAYIIDLSNVNDALDKIIDAIEGHKVETFSMIDVIEHLDYPNDMLSAIAELFKSKSDFNIILSVPNFAHIDVSTKFIAASWDYTETGLLDRTHRVIYTEENLQRLMESVGWIQNAELDYRLEKSEQYFLEISKNYFSQGGMDTLIRHIKRKADRNYNVYQFVRSYQSNNKIKKNTNSNIIISFLLCNRDDFLGLLALIHALDCAEYYPHRIQLILSPEVNLTNININNNNIDVVRLSSGQEVKDVINGKYALFFTKNSLWTSSSLLNVIKVLSGRKYNCLTYAGGGDSSKIGIQAWIELTDYLTEDFLNYTFLPVNYMVNYEEPLCFNLDQIKWVEKILCIAARTGVEFVKVVESKKRVDDRDVLIKSYFPINELGFEVSYQLFILNGKFPEGFLRINNKLLNTLNSRSWRLTRPFRCAWNLMLRCHYVFQYAFKNPRKFFRLIYQRMPFLIGLRLIFNQFMLSLKGKITEFFDSSSNLKALQVISERRFSFHPNSLVFGLQPIIDVSVVTYNSSKWIDGFFESLLVQEYPLHKLNLCIVDNGSKDNTVEKLLGWRNRLVGKCMGFEILEGENIGFGAGHDKAIKNGQSEFILISNIDIAFKFNSISIVVATAYADKAGIVASWELRQAPYEHPKYYDPVTHETNWSSHACILIRRSAYIEVGGYDKEIFMYGEDVELSYRFRSYGYQLKYCPLAVVHHYTYEHENHVKPLQFNGSTLANSYLRLRYGKTKEKISIFLLQIALFFRPAVYSGVRRDIVSNMLLIFRKLPHFLYGRGSNKGVYFPFRYFDYEMSREGAFHTIGQPLVEFPLVTIITRTYRNRNEFLRQAIISVLNQTYPNIELIIVEDGGETMKDLVSEFHQAEQRSIQFYGMSKFGRSVTGNYGLEKAKGTYCMFLDDDDLLFSDHVEVLVTALANNPESVAAYSLAMEVRTETVTDGRYTEVSYESPSCYKEKYDYDVLLDHNFIPIQSLLFQRKLYLNRGGFETDMSQLEDWNLWLRYGFGNTFTYVPKTTSMFRTPSDPNVRLQRHKSLHAAYTLAKERAVMSCNGYNS